MHGMLGKISLSAWQGLRDELERRVAGQEGEMWLDALRKVSRKENPWPVASAAEKSFPTWKTLSLGCTSAKAYRAMLKAAGMGIGDYASQMLDKIPANSVATEVDLVKVTPADLGLKNGGTYAEICTRAKESNLDLCPTEVGPKLRLEYKDQPRNEWIRIAMEPITASDGRLGVFDVGHDDDGPWLCRDCGNSDFFWLADCRFVFVRRKSA